MLGFLGWLLQLGLLPGTASAGGLDVEACYQRYGPMVLRRCRALLRDEARAVDAMQDVFVQLLVAAPRLEDQGLSSLLYRMATNRCLNVLRSQRRRPESPGDDLLLQIASASDVESQTWAQRLLGQLFEGEPESTRTMAVLHLVDGLTLEEVANEVGMSVSGVRKRLRKLRAQLHLLEGQTGLEEGAGHD